MGGFSSSVTPETLQAAVAARVPAPGANTPPATNLTGDPGQSPDYARADHTHAVRVQRMVAVTANDGTLKWTFAKPIVCAKGALPPVANMVEDTGSPVVVQIVGREFTTSADGKTDTHTSVSVKAMRSQLLPSAIVTVTSLQAFNTFGLPASGVRVNLWAGDPTQ